MNEGGEGGEQGGCAVSTRHTLLVPVAELV
jgi:hypothetical protein